MSGVPPSWARVTLGNVADIRLGKMLDRARTKGTPRLYLRNVNVRWDSVDTTDLFTMPFKDEELDRYAIRPGDLLVCEGGEPGRSAIWTHGETDLKYQKALHRVRLNNGVAGRWVMFSLMRDASTGQLSRRFTGSTIAHLPREKLVEYELTIPPAAEQERIIEALDSHLTRLDAAVASLDAAQQKLKAYRASVLKAAVEGRLVPTDAELGRTEGRSYEPADVLLERILTERRRRWELAEVAKMKATGKTPKDDKWKTKYQEPALPDTDTLPRLPEGWCWSTVEQLAGADKNALCDGPFGSNLKTEHYTESGPRVVRLQNIGDGEFESAEAHISDEHFESLKRHAVRAGDLVVASLGTELPRACRVPSSLGPAIVKADCLRFNVDEMLADPRFVLHALNASPTRKRVGALVHGVGRPRIGLTLFRQTAIPLPPRTEQERIADHVDELISVARTIDLNLAVQGRRSNRLRQAVLGWAFEGKLVDQDPADEPADVSLARIRAERAAAAPARLKTKRARELKATS